MSLVITFACQTCWKKEIERVSGLDKQTNKGKSLFHKTKTKVDTNQFMRTTQEIEFVSNISYGEDNKNDHILEEPNKFKGIKLTCPECKQVTFNYTWEAVDLL